MGTTEQQGTLDREFVEEFARDCEEAWAARVPEQIARKFTEDVTFIDPALRGPLHGRDRVRRFATEIFRMVPDFVVITTDRPHISPTQPRVLLPYRMSGTMTGRWEFLEMAPTGRSFEIEGVDCWELRDGLIARYRTFYDALDMSRQLGVLPPAGSRRDRAMARLQRGQAWFQRRSAE
jgi:hypothetical protein